MVSARRSRTTIGHRRRAFKEDSLLGWVSSTRSRIETAIGTRGRGSPVDEELGKTADEQELEPLDNANEATGEDQGSYKDVAEASVEATDSAKHD